MGIGEIGNLLITAACTIQIRLKVTRNMGMVCVFLSLRNIMKMHDCRKRQVEIERQRSRTAAKQEKKGKKIGKQNREKQEKQRSRKAGKKQNSGKAGKAYKQRTKEQTRRKAEK